MFILIYLFTLTKCVSYLHIQELKEKGGLALNIRQYV